MINLNHIAKSLSIITILLLVSCKNKAHEQLLETRQQVQDSINKTPEGKAYNIPPDTFEILVYDGCQYLIYKEQRNNTKVLGFMAHKGNCNNPIHQSVSE